MKLQHILEMAKPAQVCGNCGKGPIHKTHNWVKGVGWKCRKANLIPNGATPVAEPVQSAPVKTPARAQSATVSLSNPKWAKLATDDYQERDGAYPKAGVPDQIEVFDDGAAFMFKNTSERDARAWVQTFVLDRGMPGKISGSSQDGDYLDDWVSVHVK